MNNFKKMIREAYSKELDDASMELERAFNKYTEIIKDEFVDTKDGKKKVLSISKFRKTLYSFMKENKF